MARKPLPKGMKARRARRAKMGLVSRNARKSMAKIAKQVFTRLSEDKVIKQNYRYTLHNDPNNLAWQDNVRDATAPIRSLVQGTGTSNRIGAKIRLTKVMYNFCLSPNLGLEDAQAYVVKMWVISDRFGLNNASTSNVIDACKTPLTTIGNILEDNNTSQGFQRDLQDIFTPINAERFKVYHSREYKLAPASAVNNNTTLFSYGNNDFKLFVRGRINLLKYLPKTFKYIDNQTNTQMSRKIFILWQVVSATGSTLSATDNLINVSDGYNITFDDN